MPSLHRYTVSLAQRGSFTLVGPKSEPQISIIRTFETPRAVHINSILVFLVQNIHYSVAEEMFPQFPSYIFSAQFLVLSCGFIYIYGFPRPGYVKSSWSTRNSKGDAPLKIGTLYPPFLLCRDSWRISSVVLHFLLILTLSLDSVTPSLADRGCFIRQGDPNLLISSLMWM